MFDDLKQVLEDVGKAWDQLPEEDQDYFIKAVAMIPAQFIGYKFYKRLGAPKWAAWGLTTLSTNVVLSPDRAAYEARQRLKRQIKKMDDQFKS